MIADCKVECMGHEFNCVDEGFGENVPVDVVIRPEDIYIMNKIEGAQFTGIVKSCTFKGVHYEMFVDTDSHNELMVQDYNAFEVGSTVGLFIKPFDIQVMKKERTCNTFEGVMTSEKTVEFCHGEFYCADTDWAAGTRVKVEINFDKVDLRDDRDEGTLVGEVSFILYKGNHYHITITTDDNDNFYVDTNDIWDKWDMVGIRIQPEDIHLTKLTADNE